jgi:hypothetical protein
MAAIKMFIDKFKKVVLIDEDHPLVLEQKIKNAAPKVAAPASPAEPSTPAAKTTKEK